MSEATACARFKLDNARVIRFKELPKVAFLTVLVQAGKWPDYHEVVMFQPAAFPLNEGDAINVAGEIQKKKPKDGGNTWTVELIGRVVTKGDDEKAPRPRRSVDRPPTHTTMPVEDDVDF